MHIDLRADYESDCVMHCPLCSCNDAALHETVGKRELFLCPRCSLIFVPEAFHLTVDDERKRYDLHDNTDDNEGYVRFLLQVVNEVQKYCITGATILDYGSGKNAVLTKLFKGAGYRCDPYDPLYTLPLQNKRRGMYDVVVLCEVIEHCRDLEWVISDIRKYLKPDGMVLLRTQLYPENGHIAGWWYAQDATHIRFFSRTSLAFLARCLGQRICETCHEDIFLTARANNDN